MKTRYYALTAILLAGSFTMNAQTKKTAKAAVVAPAQEKLTILDSASYSFGLKVAQGLKSDGVDRLNYSLLAKAMEDVFNDRETLLTDEQASSSIGIFLEAASKSRFASLLEEGEKFLATNKVKTGITTTESGLQYEVLKAGSGAKPKLEDDVTVHYKGSLLNGKQFDSSYDRGEPIELQLNRVIPGWTEGLQLMPEGSKYRFFIPYQLAYGERGAGQDIPPYSTLIFEVELIKIGK
jgi:FKBP-type peptidyl-prolyl cis-trans isomerase